MDYIEYQCKRCDEPCTMRVYYQLNKDDARRLYRPSGCPCGIVPLVVHVTKNTHFLESCWEEVESDD